jgi:hypothetical protein
MKKYTLLLLVTLGCVFLFSAMTPPDEGEWLLTQIQKLPLAEMQKHGLTLTPDQIFNPNGVCLATAIVRFPGGTGSFVSKDGLIITNHHIAWGGIQALSSVQDDYLKNGFLAETKDKELSCPSYSVSVLQSIKEVTDSILAVVKDTMSAENRSKAIQDKSRELEKAAKGETENECRVQDAYNGVKYFLYTYEVIRDVRMVYAPPEAIGVYGGETDNWVWPRHTGDFALMRAYVAPDGKHAKYSKDNVPYHPKAFLPISTKPKKEGDFSMVIGFPGQTFRYRTASEVKLAAEETLPLIVELFQKRIDIVDAATKNDRALEIMYAAKIRNVANYYKKYKGTLDGMKRLNLQKQRDELETAFHAYIDTKSELEEKYESVLSDIAAAQHDLKSFNKKSQVLGQLSQAVDMVRLANRFKGYANSFKQDSTGAMKPTGEAELKEFITTAFKDIDIRIDKEMFKAFLGEVADLPEAQQVKAVKNIVRDKKGEDRDKAIREFVDDIYRDSHLTTPEEALKLTSKSADDIKDEKFVKFVIAIDEDYIPLQAQVAKYNSQIVRLRGEWLKGLMAWKGNDIYPDANSSIRFTYGTVKRLDPRNAVHYDFITSVGGIMEKETGEGEFIVPKKERELWEKKDFGPYADPILNDVPVAYITDNDITGGNSGSPVINGNGELVGVAFDGNWEAVVDDYFYEPNLDRTIIVDSRYVLWILDKFSNAKNVLDELVIK